MSYSLNLSLISNFESSIPPSPLDVRIVFTDASTAIRKVNE